MDSLRPGPPNAPAPIADATDVAPTPRQVCHVAVAIVGFRNASDIEVCLEALEASTHREFEVVICENGGPAAYQQLHDATPRRLRGGQPIRLVCAPSNLGYAGGVNVCLRESAKADAWWILNPDTCPEPPAMESLVERLSAGDCEAVGGVVFYPDGAVQSYGGHWGAWLASPRAIGFGARLGDPVDSPGIERRLSYISGASMLVGRRFLDTVGLLREDYFLYCEEVEWFLRGAALGMRLGFAPQARVLHHQGTTTGSVRKLSQRPRAPVYLDTRNKVLVTRDHFPRRLPVAAVAIMAVTGLRCLKHGAWRQLGYALAGWWAGLLNERGAPRWLRV